MNTIDGSNGKVGMDGARGAGDELIIIFSAEAGKRNGVTEPVEAVGRIGDTLLDVALRHGVDIPNNCGGVGACGTCHVKIRDGMDCISEMDDAEQDRLDIAPDSDLDSRLACRCQLIRAGRITVEIPMFHGISHSH